MPPGRPRRFEPDAAVAVATRLFWERGYEGTSVAELAERIGVQPGSLYAAFGNKEALFTRALAHYQSSISGFVPRALAAATAAEVVEIVLRGIVEVASGAALPGERTPTGCLFVHGALGTSPDAEPVRAMLARRRAEGEAALAARFAELAAGGDPVARTRSPEVLARWLVSLRYGLAVQARSGATRDQLHEVVDLALSGAPMTGPEPVVTGLRDTRPPRPDGPGSVADLVGLDDELAGSLHSRWVEANGQRLHVVTGGSGPPVLLLAGWPQTWFAWHAVLPHLLARHTVVALDARGVGLSDKPADGYDTGTLAADAAEVMTVLGHDTFAVVGHDIGMWVGYALAGDRPHRVSRLAVLDAVIPGLAAEIPLFASADVVERLWHCGFNRVSGINEDLVRGRERQFFGYQFTSKAARPLAASAVEVYLRALTAGPDALRASFGPYRALDATIRQNVRRRQTPLSCPVLTIAGELSSGPLVEQTMRAAGSEVESLVLPGCGHFPAEEAPEETAAALLRFLSTR